MRRMFRIAAAFSVSFFLACSTPKPNHGGEPPDASGVGTGGGDESDMAAGSDDMAVVVPSGPLVIAPLDAVLAAAVGQPAPTVNYSATIDGLPVSAEWKIDRYEVA